MSAKVIFGLSALPIFLLSVQVRDAEALPWDRDLYRQQSYQAGEIARAPATGTVPVGHVPFRMNLDEAEKGLKNPAPSTRDSLWRGKRLYKANCLTCHGELLKGDGPVAQKYPAFAVPDLQTDYYKGYGDGRIYGIMMNGGSNMPRYGYKFSEQERWDVVNYVRHLQGKAVQSETEEKVESDVTR